MLQAAGTIGGFAASPTLVLTEFCINLTELDSRAAVDVDSTP
jgi:hypothetical protein